ncbi:baseplate hub protein [Francisella marina]|uniref:Viral coat protein P2 N-terminal domain-containing protein n=1 Tax=Francisella marina TaxID=2249302 RepID=A0ABX5ZGJ3_9GAMM|nr:hypothetical protein [Francisella marina]QEO57556.1 hypothetical protein F0R74_06710 [Francisella marina]
MLSNKQRYKRSYDLYIQADNQTFYFKDPLKIAFSCVKSINGGQNKLNIDIYNLSQSSRNAIKRTKAGKNIIKIQLDAGYVDNKATIFKGNVLEAYSDKQGTEFITRIEAYEAEQENLSWSFTTNTVGDTKTAVNYLIKQKVQKELDTNIDLVDIPNNLRPIVMVGTTDDLIKQYIGEDNHYFIDNDKVNILPKTKYKTQFIPDVNAENGLYAPPKNDDGFIVAKTLLNPAIQIGGAVNLESIFNPSINGVYKVETIQFTGDNWADEWTQELQLFSIDNIEVLD